MATNSICSKEGCRMHKVTKCNEFWCVVLSRSTGSKLGMTWRSLLFVAPPSSQKHSVEGDESGWSDNINSCLWPRNIAQVWADSKCKPRHKSILKLNRFWTGPIFLPLGRMSRNRCNPLLLLLLHITLGWVGGDYGSLLHNSRLLQDMSYYSRLLKNPLWCLSLCMVYTGCYI